ncbi:MAG: hypothetical protein LBT59_06845, partial [Clostridiales bacterium]|nr:hypothetical protein [Clostridiales bacterium]
MKSSKTFLCLFLTLAVLSASLTGCASNMEDEFNPQNSQLAPGSDDSGVTGASEDSDVATTNEPYVAINEVYVAAKEAYAAVNEPDVTDNEAYVPDSEPDVADNEVYVPDNEVYVPDNEVYVPDSEPDAPDNEVYVPTSEPDAATSEPDVPTSEPDAPTSEPDAPTSEPDVPKALATYEELNPDFPEPHASFARPYVPVASTSLDSDKIDDNGYWKGVRALDFVELFDISAIHIPASVHTIDPAKV